MTAIAIDLSHLAFGLAFDTAVFGPVRHRASAGRMVTLVSLQFVF
jgi:hypothetical protein